MLCFTWCQTYFIIVSTFKASLCVFLSALTNFPERFTELCYHHIKLTQWQFCLQPLLTPLLQKQFIFVKRERAGVLTLVHTGPWCIFFYILARKTDYIRPIFFSMLTHQRLCSWPNPLCNSYRLTALQDCTLTFHALWLLPMSYWLNNHFKMIIGNVDLINYPWDESLMTCKAGRILRNRRLTVAEALVCSSWRFYPLSHFTHARFV